MPPRFTAARFVRLYSAANNLKHPLAVLASRIPWRQIETALAPSFVRKDREGKVIADSDLFGATLAIAGGGISAAGRPALLRVRVTPRAVRDNPGVLTSNDLGWTVGNKAGRNSRLLGNCAALGGGGCVFGHAKSRI